MNNFEIIAYVVILTPILIALTGLIISSIQLAQHEKRFKKWLIASRDYSRKGMIGEPPRPEDFKLKRHT